MIAETSGTRRHQIAVFVTTEEMQAIRLEASRSGESMGRLLYRYAAPKIDDLKQKQSAPSKARTGN